MSAGVFPPTSSRSTRRRTSTCAPEFAGYSGLHEAASQGSAPTFLRRRRGRPDRTVGPDGRPDRPGANGAFACPKQAHFLPRSPPCRSSEPILALLQAPLSPQAPSVSPGCLSPKPTLGARAPQFSATVLRGAPERSRSCPPRAAAPARNSRSLAAYLARYGEHGSHLRGLMRMNDPCPGNVLI